MSNLIKDLYHKLQGYNNPNAKKKLNQVNSWTEALREIVTGQAWTPVRLPVLQQMFTILRSASVIHRKLQKVESESAKTQSKLEIEVKHREAEIKMLLKFISDLKNMSKCTCQDDPGKCFHCLCETFDRCFENDRHI